MCAYVYDVCACVCDTRVRFVGTPKWYQRKRGVTKNQHGAPRHAQFGT